MDADYYSPTHRKRIEDYASPFEKPYIFTTPNLIKLTKLTHENFRNIAHSTHALIESKGVIVLDGVGRHSPSTDSLFELSNALILLCYCHFDVGKNSKECGFVKNGESLHPFDFYNAICERFGISDKKYIRIETRFHSEKIASFDEDKLKGELFDLDWEVIKNGNVDRVPQKTREIIQRIARLTLATCYKGRC